MSTSRRRLVTEALEDRRVLSVNPIAVTDKVVSMQNVGSGSLAVEMEIKDLTSSGSNGSNAAPQATGVAEFKSSSGSEYLVELPSAFSDAETAATDLIFSVVGNSNPSVFNNVSIDAGGNLLLNFNPNMAGSSNLTIQAEDGDGGSSTFLLAVSGEEFQSLDITSFTGYRDGDDEDSWTFEGQVDGADDNSDVTIVFGGDFGGHTSSVDPDGSFSYTGSTTGSTGIVTAQAQSSNGNSTVVSFDLDDDD